MVNEEKEIVKEENEYCKCEGKYSFYSDTTLDEWGYWDVCNECDKKIEDGFHYYSEAEVYD